MNRRLPAVSIDYTGIWEPPRYEHDRWGRAEKRNAPKVPLPQNMGHRFGGRDSLTCFHCGLSWYEHRQDPKECPKRASEPEHVKKLRREKIRTGNWENE
jgi:hypothetical protein